MESRFATIAFCLLAVGAAFPAFAQQYDDDPVHQDHRDRDSDQGHSDQGRGEDPHNDGARNDGPRGNDRGDRRQWNRGEHYDGNRQFVDDWRGHGLREPPRGHRWVRDENGDYVLVALASGIITDLLLNAHGR